MPAAAQAYRVGVPTRGGEEPVRPAVVPHTPANRVMNVVNVGVVKHDRKGSRTRSSDPGWGRILN